MNYCNFGKVLIARATKDLEAIKWWNSDKKDDCGSGTIKQNLSENFTLKDRYYNYEKFIEGYPRMNISYPVFQTKQAKIQGFLTDKKYWLNNSKNGEKKLFLEHFSLQNWTKMSDVEKKQHKIEDCVPCNSTHLISSQLHKSVSSLTSNIQQNCEEATKSMISMVSPNSHSKRKGIQVVKIIVNLIQPIVEKDLNIEFDRKLEEHITLSPPINPKDHQIEIRNSIKKSKTLVEQSLRDNGKDLSNFLGSPKSYNQYSRDRMDACFESTDEAAIRVQKDLEKEKRGKKCNQHHGRFSSYDFCRDEFLKK